MTKLGTEIKKEIRRWDEEENDNDKVNITQFNIRWTKIIFIWLSINELER